MPFHTTGVELILVATAKLQEISLLYCLDTARQRSSSKTVEIFKDKNSLRRTIGKIRLTSASRDPLSHLQLNKNTMHPIKYVGAPIL